MCWSATTKPPRICESRLQPLLVTKIHGRDSQAPILSLHFRSEQQASTHAMDASRLEFEDHLPAMAQRLGKRGLMRELEKGFYLLADPASNTITPQSLQRSARLLGMPPMADAELRDIIRMGDSGGCGQLDLRQFCVTMIRLSPALMDQALAAVFLDSFCGEGDIAEDIATY